MATIVHTMINLMQLYNTHFSPKDSEHLFHAVIVLFCAMSSSLKIDFAPFIKLIQETLKEMKRQSTEFSKQIEETTKINLVDLFKYNLEVSTKHAEGDNEDGDDEGPLQTFGFFDGAAGVGQPGRGGGSRASGSTGWTAAELERNGRNQMGERGNLYVQKRDEPSMAREYENRCGIIDIGMLMHEFDTDRLAIEADWIEWLKKTSYQLLKQSPNPVIFACSIVAEVFNSLA